MNTPILRSCSLLIVATLPAATLAGTCEENAAQPKAVTVRYATDDRRALSLALRPAHDGTLRAFDDTTNSELWSFTPATLDTTHRADGLMTDLRVLRFDADLDGEIDPATGDRVHVYFGLRRGGEEYYALDISERLSPRPLWQIGPAELPGIGETWSTPTLARIRIASAAQNGEHLVLIFGGGYDEASLLGRGVYIVDAQSGQMLWQAGHPTAGSLDLALPRMTHPITARLVALDIDGDEFADRLYTADVGGSVWRFDIWNGRSRDQLITGGVIAALAGVTPEDARRFFHAPDVALIQRRGANAYYNLAIGSGDRAQPFDSRVRDRFYAIRDRHSFTALTQSEYDSLTPVSDADLLDITDEMTPRSIPDAGWKLELRLHGGWSGEKVLAESTTLNGIILFPTYKPISEAACSGENRLYALSVDHGKAATDLNDDHEIDVSDVSIGLAQHGIANEVEVTLARPGAEGEPRPKILCSIGSRALPGCAAAPLFMRRFWHRLPED